ncbi:hypothetical protein [Cohnella algarum]|uniref:hypothetical protein n=1 Tax=Cohnella algarum TaxID=2044859 RepID=UPI0019685989|nr:hypothetical protein [Cohnella algarum]MBN2981850.1 hypothetical protein [Cohnella algarum]
MIQIKKNSVILEMERNDLWQLGTALKNGIISECKLKWIRYFQGDSELEFIHYVRSNHHLIFKYLEEIYSFLERTDLLESLETELIKLFQDDRGSGN